MNLETDPRTLLTLDRVAKEAGVCNQTVRRDVLRGRLHPYRPHPKVFLFDPYEAYGYAADRKTHGRFRVKK